MHQISWHLYLCFKVKLEGYRFCSRVNTDIIFHDNDPRCSSQVNGLLAAVLLSIEGKAPLYLLI